MWAVLTCAGFCRHIVWAVDLCRILQAHCVGCVDLCRILQAHCVLRILCTKLANYCVCEV